MTIRDRDEGAHEPGARGWWETWHLDAASDEGIGVSVRLACAPGLGIAWWWTYVVLPDLPGPVVVRDHEVPLPRQGLEVRADGLWGELTCEAPFEHWTYGLEAFGVRLDDPADALLGEIGERLPVGLDIEWEVEPDGPERHDRPADWPVAGYSQTGAVRGEVLLGRSRIELDAHGLRTHWWGDPGAVERASTAWMHAPALDLSFVQLGADRLDGSVARRGVGVRSMFAVREEMARDVAGRPVAGRPVAGRYVIDDDLEINVEVLGIAPVPLADRTTPGAVLTRALCRFDAGAEPGTGTPRAGNGWASRLHSV